MRAIAVRRPLLEANALESVILRHPDLVYRSLMIVLAEGKHAALMHFEGSPAALSTLRAEYVDSHPAYILDIEVVQESARSMVTYKVEKSGTGPVEIAGLVYKHFGAQCVARVTKDVTGAEWNILTFNDDAVAEFLKTMRSRGAFTALESRQVTTWELARYATAYWVSPFTELSAQEEKTLKRAVKLGYFDTPRQADVRDLAQALRVPHSTAHHHLKGATSKVIKRAVEGI